jgi:hypothetical protein
MKLMDAIETLVMELSSCEAKQDMHNSIPITAIKNTIRHPLSAFAGPGAQASQPPISKQYSSYNSYFIQRKYHKISIYSDDEFSKNMGYTSVQLKNTCR